MHKVLVANRGEIAIRIIRACRDLGIQTVAVYSEVDAESLHVLYADESVCIGEAPSAKSYLKIPNILAACEVTGADALHPGYGFLAENANFASICASCDVKFIGPSSQAISLLGNKARAKSTAKSVNCPVIPGSDGAVEDPKEALEIAKELGFPVLIKAVSGGGGKGIRFVESPADFLRMFTAARTEAEASFGDPSIYLEKMIMRPRHVEVQVLADEQGNCIHLGERDCTIQRRRQKLIEEAPSPVVSPELREEMGAAAVRLAKASGYSSAGTVEFLLDEEHNFYFMEMNTRIQVEHTVTEELTGVDLVREQILVAKGESLSLTQEEVRSSGHAIEFRINAENPHKNFAPSPGRIDYLALPGGPHVRVDTHCYAGYMVPPSYDSMIAKLVVRGKDREEAIAVGRRALAELRVGGVDTTTSFHQYMLQDPNFLAGDQYDLHYVDHLLKEQS